MNIRLKQCLTRPDLSGMLGVSTRTLRRMDRDGTGPRPIRVGPHTVRYAPAEVAEFMNAAGLSAPAELTAGRNGFALPGSR
ncbi:hypothetical protein GOFOIKOB_4875 [Methylobacterium tardum]|uniref:Uncharacterized protein n=1 Tax=Methylobacterium tardum TaxID=374432 RepID=A0AA37TML0_9HYPH|nr:hypothetical protein [Methylobacterium tardum]URD35808.1 hypothetical protein M6G65_25680 [Methylobacterium tardum]GJE51811.1 hypothetical protein GOFOIKOB_4875 [Methylobacterium tardum]GLS72331.1 hypothetical protein GCM10007890_43440 [Methylobacterium tardum]